MKKQIHSLEELKNIMTKNYMIELQSKFTDRIIELDGKFIDTIPENEFKVSNVFIFLKKVYEEKN